MHRRFTAERALLPRTGSSAGVWRDGARTATHSATINSGAEEPPWEMPHFQAGCARGTAVGEPFKAYLDRRAVLAVRLFGFQDLLEPCAEIDL